MTEETQALLDRHANLRGDDTGPLLDDMAAALTSLARDLAAARQERDAALEMARRVGESGDHHIQMALDGRTREREAVDAAVRAARAETWAEAERFIVKLLDKLHHWGDGDATDDAVIARFEAEFRALRAARERQ